MCCDPMNDSEPVGECESCGGPIDEDGDSTDVCAHSTVECEVCGAAPCDGSC